jgi:flagellar basal body-associated protein FliL
MNPQPSDNDNQKVEPESVANGPILVLLIVLLISVLGGMYYWFTLMQKNSTTPIIVPSLRPTPEMNNEPESTTAEAQVEALEIVSTSDEVPAIEADIENTDLNSLDAELDAIEAELEAALR